MLNIIDLNCPENSILKIKLFKLLSRINLDETFIVTFIMDYNVEQLQIIEKNLDLFNKSFKSKYKVAEFNIIDTNINNGCGGRERLALVLSNINSLKNSISLIENTEDLKEIYTIYKTKSNLKLKKENW